MADKKIALNEEMLNKLPKGVFSDLIGAFGEQVGEAKLDKETRDALKEKLGVDEDTAKGWTTAGDVLKVIDTAEIILEKRDIPLKKMKGLKEMYFGTYEGVSIPEHQKEIDKIRFHTFDWREYGGEDVPMLKERMTKAYDEIYAEAKDGDHILIVSHGANFLHSLGFLFHIDTHKYVDMVRKGDSALMPVPNGFAAVFEREGDEYTLLSLNKRSDSFMEELLKG